MTMNKSKLILTAVCMFIGITCTQATVRTITVSGWRLTKWHGLMDLNGVFYEVKNKPTYFKRGNYFIRTNIFTRKKNVFIEGGEANLLGKEGVRVTKKKVTVVKIYENEVLVKPNPYRSDTMLVQKNKLEPLGEKKILVVGTAYRSFDESQFKLDGCNDYDLYLGRHNSESAEITLSFCPNYTQMPGWPFNMYDGKRIEEDYNLTLTWGVTNIRRESNPCIVSSHTGLVKWVERQNWIGKSDHLKHLKKRKDIDATKLFTLCEKGSKALEAQGFIRPESMIIYITGSNSQSASSRLSKSSNSTSGSKRPSQLSNVTKKTSPKEEDTKPTRASAHNSRKTRTPPPPPPSRRNVPPPPPPRNVTPPPPQPRRVPPPPPKRETVTSLPRKMGTVKSAPPKTRLPRVVS